VNLFGGIKGRGELYHYSQFTLWIQARHTLVTLTQFSPISVAVCSNLLRRYQSWISDESIREFLPFCEWQTKKLKIKNSKDGVEQALRVYVITMEMNGRSQMKR
jgi:hypothetical protein